MCSGSEIALDDMVEEDSQMLDVLGQMVRQHVTSRQEPLRMDPEHFIPGSVLIVEILHYKDDDDVSALTTPSAFADGSKIRDAAVSKSTIVGGLNGCLVLRYLQHGIRGVHEKIQQNDLHSKMRIMQVING
eukprot:scaffold173084_cov40-Cyclotella_meneghiniana.AAC.1